MFVILSLVTTLDMDKEQTTPQATLTTWVFAGVAEILCIAAGFTLPWGVSYPDKTLNVVTAFKPLHCRLNYIRTKKAVGKS